MPALPSRDPFCQRSCPFFQRVADPQFLADVTPFRKESKEIKMQSCSEKPWKPSFRWSKLGSLLSRSPPVRSSEQRHWACDSQKTLMAILFTCSCGKRLKVADQFGGKRCRCPGCGEIRSVPEPSAADEENALAGESPTGA